MEMWKADRIANELLKKHGLDDWKVAFNGRLSRAFGRCYYRAKTIELNTTLVNLNSEELVTETIIHEIAHALEQGGHTEAWRRKYLEIGGNGNRYYDTQTVENPSIWKEAETENGIVLIPGDKVKVQLNGREQIAIYVHTNARNHKYPVVVDLGGRKYKIREKSVLANLNR